MCIPDTRHYIWFCRIWDV